MGNVYQHLTIEERCELARLRAAGHSICQIATSMDRSTSTISRELGRNGSRNGSRTRGYDPSYADQQAHARRWRGSRLERDHSLRHRVFSCLQQGWSPQLVAGRLARESGRTVISHETIYRFIYAQLAHRKDFSWCHYLPKAKSKRGWRGRQGGSSSSFIHLRRSLDQRSQDADDRSLPGHWEADLTLFGDRGQSLLTLTERRFRVLLAVPQSHQTAASFATALSKMLAPFPPQLRRTVSFDNGTFDNGTEFAHHYQLHNLGIQTFFCGTHSPWQKGGGGEWHRPPASLPAQEDGPGSAARPPA